MFGTFTKSLTKQEGMAMENETLKRIVLAKCQSVAPEAGTTYTTNNGTILRTNDRQIGDDCNQWRLDEFRESGWIGLVIDDDAPADSHVWAIAAECLGIAKPVPFFESQLAIRQHHHELRQAFDAGYSCPIPREDGWEQFIGDYGKKETAQPVPFFESQLHELCVALGWQGGTYHLVLAEVKRLKAYESDNREPSHC